VQRFFTEKQVDRLFTKEEQQRMRTFNTGATRDSDNYKLDYEGFLSPLAMKRYAEYMHHHRKQADGKMRPSDNWQKGIPREAYMKSMYRHFMDVWAVHRGQMAVDPASGGIVTLDEALCAVLFNAFGYLHETLKQKPVPLATYGPSGSEILSYPPIQGSDF